MSRSMAGRSLPSAAPVVLNGRYEMGRLIAEGGMAQVYRGRDRVLDREVAIKVLRPQYAASPEFLARFRREARLAASLAHPNLVNVFDVGHDGDRHYIVMELLPGRTLKDLVAHGPLPLDQAVDLALQVAKGMAYAHRRGLVHRDLKPQNVLLTEDVHAKVADFGLAQAGETAQLTTPGTVWGTVQYISPEQAQGLRPDARSDVYALGAMFYELLTGHPPYEGGTPASIMMRHVYDPPPALRAAAPALPLAAERVLSRAMAKAPMERFQTMDEFAQALADLRAAAGAETMVWSPLPDGTPTWGPGGAGAVGRGDAETRRRGEGVTRGGRDAETRVRGNGRTVVMPPAALGGVARSGTSRYGAPSGAAARGAAVPVAGRRRRGWLPLALAGSVLVCFALLAVGALLAGQLAGPLGAGVRATPAPRATATLVPTATPVPPTATPAPTPIPQVPVPSVVGQPLARAKERLAESGLAVETAEDFSRDVPAGAVAAQDPPANTQLEQGKTVKLTISKGPQRVAVPPVIGDSVDVATDKLTKAGFAVEKLEDFNPQAAKGLVYEQAPRSQTLADAGSKVTIKVSKGRDEVVVPRVIGQPEQAAAEAVTKAGLKPDVVYEPITTVDPGWVFAQDPIPDAKADRGSTVVLRVRRDPTPAPTATATPAPARTATPAPAASATGAPVAGTAAATRPATTVTPGR